jgi:hypothetical protein
LRYALIWLTGELYAVVWQFQMMKDVNSLAGTEAFPRWVRALLLCGWAFHAVVLVSFMTLGFGAPGFLLGWLILSSVGLMISLFAIPVAAVLHTGRIAGSGATVGDAVEAILLSFLWFASFPYAQARINRLVGPAGGATK